MISRSGNIYVKLPEGVRTPKRTDASISISISITTTKEMEKMSAKALEKFISDAMDNLGKDFKKLIKKRAEKMLESEE